jgi:competence protein ComEC
VVGGFLTGVFARSLLPIGIAYVFLAVLLACIALTAGFLGSVKLQSAIVGAVTLVSLASGIMRMDAATLSGDPHLTAALGTHVTLIGTVEREPDVRDNGVRISIDARELISGTTTIPVHAGILVEAPPHAAVRYGDEVRASGMLDLPQAFDTGPGRSFDYPDYLAVTGIEYLLSFADIHRTDANHDQNIGMAVESFAIDAKQLYLAGEGAILPEPEAGLAGGITVGDKRSIGPELSAEFQKVGLLQIVVLSGYNITVVANFASALLAWSSRYFQFGAGIIVVVFFILISGGAASAVRAGLMAALAMYARLSGRTYDSLRGLAFAALVMIMWNPFTLVFDPGFQLSALAMLGLALFTPTFDSYLQWLPKRFALREIVATTLATQIAVLPLILYQDGLLTLLALPANVLSMIPVPLAMLSSFIASSAGIFFGTYAAPLAYPAYILLAYIIEVAHVFAGLPFASVMVGAFNAWWMFGAYALMFGGFLLLQKKKSGEVKSSAAPAASIT